MHELAVLPIMSAFIPIMTAPVLPPSSPKKRVRKPPGYWSDPAVLSAELVRFAPRTRMPTAAELLAAGRADLCRAVQRYGGFAKAAQKTGLAPNRQRQQKKNAVWQPAWRPPKIPKSLAAPTIRKTALQRQELSTPAPAPRPKRRYERRGPPRRARGYWLAWSNLAAELRAFAKRFCAGYMPSQRELRAANRTDIMNAVRHHGGITAVARRAGLSPAPAAAAKKPHGHWSDPAALHAELLTFTARYGHPGLMPRRDQLLRAGRADLNYAIQKHGGYSAVAAELHLVWYGPSSYWRVFRNLQRRLLAFVKLQKRGPIMPSFDTLQRRGRMDLVYGIALHGGMMAVARRTGLKVVFPERAPGYWERPENVQQELEDILLTQPLEARRSMPSSVLLVHAGRADLATAVRDHGGWLYYAQRLGLRFDYEVRQQGFWEKEENVLRELVHYVALRYGSGDHLGNLPSFLPSLDDDRVGNLNISAERGELPKVTCIPPTDMLKRDGRSDIAFAIERYHGGMQAFADKHSLVVAEDVVHVKPAEVLHEWVHFASELSNWIANHGANGFMPSRQDLIRTGRHDLRYATYTHGGAARVSQRLQLVFAEAPVDEWLPQWLGLQAGKLGLAIQLNERKEKLSETERKVLESLDTQLDGSVLGKYRLMMVSSESDVVTNWKRYARRTRRRTLRKTGGVGRIRNESKSESLSKISAAELEKLRRRYKHLPPDDIITV